MMEIMNAHVKNIRTDADIVDSARFAQMCMDIYDNLCTWHKGDRYLECSHVRTRMDGTREWILSGRYGDVIRRYDHYPTEREINNDIVFRFNLNSRHLIK